MAAYSSEALDLRWLKRLVRLLQQKGLERERAYLEQLKAEERTVAEVAESGD